MDVYLDRDRHHNQTPHANCRDKGLLLLCCGSIKQAEGDVSDLIDGFIAFLSNHQESQAIAKNLYNVLYKLYGFSIGDPAKIKEAIFAQATLAILLSSVYYESIRYVYKLDSLDTLAKATDAQQGLEKATETILKIDFPLNGFWIDWSGWYFQRVPIRVKAMAEFPPTDLL